MIDIDECDAYNAGCQQICHNGNGSFVCECRDGYTTDDHGYTCDSKTIKTIYFYTSKT